MTFRMQDLMIDTLPGSEGLQPGRLLCGATSCAKSSPLGPETPQDPEPDPTEPACGPSSCGAKSVTTDTYMMAGAHLAALRQQLADTLSGLQ
jgi:hypothetical protein